MRLRLPRWLRREPAPRGRHVRRPAPVTAPGAAAALVIGAAEPYLVAPTPPYPSTAEHPPVEPPAVTASDAGPLTEPLPAIPAATAVTHAETSSADAVPAGEAVADGPVAAEPTVALGFADGGVLELAPDDPRLAGFQDAAAAVLGRPQP